MRKWLAKIISLQNLWRRFSPQIRSHFGSLMISLFCGLTALFLSLLEPWPLRIIFDYLFWQEPLPARFSTLTDYFQKEKFWTLGCLIGISVLVSLSRTAFSTILRAKTAKIGQQIACQIQSELYQHLHNLPLSFHERQPTGDLLSRLTSDIHALRIYLISLPFTLILDATLCVATVLILGWMDWMLASITLLTVPFLLLLVRRYRTPFKQAMRKQRQRESRLSQTAYEGLKTTHVIQSFNREPFEIEKFKANNRKSLKNGLRATRLEAKLYWASEFSIALMTALIFAVGGSKVMQSMISPGELIIFAHYLRIFSRPLRRISKFTEQMSRLKSSGERVLSLLEKSTYSGNEKEAEETSSFQGEIRYENVSFEYNEGKPILDAVNFTIAPKQKVALLGPSGAGKSTLASLLPRFYDCTKGKIYIDGIDTKSLNLHSLRKSISIIFQEPLLFSGTIADNIAYGSSEASRAKIISAAEHAGIHAIIEKLPQGYDTPVGERGLQLSEGQKQCIAIARAMMKNAPIVILDEPTAHLDSEASSLVIQAIDRLIKDKTAIIISHGKELTQSVDYTITIEKGRQVDANAP